MTTASSVACGRRRFLAELLRERVLTPLAEAQAGVRDDLRREALETALESELRAFGPEVLAATARGSSGAPADDDASDYATVAKALAGTMAGPDDDPE